MSSDVRSKWWLLYSLLHPTTTKHLNRLGDILVYPSSGVKTMADCTAHSGGSVLKQQCWSTVGRGLGLCLCRRHFAKNLRTAWSEKVLMTCGDLKKKHWVDFYHIGWLCTHTAKCQHTFKLKHHAKVNFASDDPFKETLMLSLTCFEKTK